MSHVRRLFATTLTILFCVGHAYADHHAPKVKGEPVTYTAGGVTMKGWLAYDANHEGPRPGVLVVHEWWGHNAYARKRAEMLAAMGYTALAVDMYGDGKVAGHPKDAMTFSKALMGDAEAVKARFLAAKQLLNAHPTTDPEQTAAIGYCMGGGVVLRMVRAGLDLDAAASFHGSLGAETPAKPGSVKAALLVAHGAADPFVPAKAVEAFKAEMKAAGVVLRFVAYPGAKHAFTNPEATALGAKFELPLAYDKSADEQSWGELEALLARAFPKKPSEKP